MDEDEQYENYDYDNSQDESNSEVPTNSNEDDLGKQFKDTTKSAIDFGKKTGKLAFSIGKKILEETIKKQESIMKKNSTKTDS